MIRVLVVEDHKRMRARLHALLATADDIQVAGVAASVVGSVSWGEAHRGRADGEQLRRTAGLVWA
jgi:chemotaxis response regulator CheB